MARNLEPGENPFRERNPVNAERRRQLMQGGRDKLDQMQKILDERAVRARRFPNS